MKLEVGKQYVTVAGKKVEIVYSYVTDSARNAGVDVRYVALVEGRADPVWYCEGGAYRGKVSGAQYTPMLIERELCDPLVVYALVAANGLICETGDTPDKLSARGVGDRVIKLVEEQ